MVKVSIIILSYNTEKLLKDCLTSLFSRIDKTSFEVIVVDNASSDDSVAMVKKDFPKVAIVENDTNLGFAKGCNIGVKEAQGEYLLFLNSDTKLTDDPLPAMLSVFDQHKKVGVVGGLLKNTDGTYQRSFGEFYTLKNVFVLLFGGEKQELKRFSPDTTKQVDWVSGGFLLVKKEVFEQVGGYNEAYFMYIEDMDLCFSVKKRGYEVWFTPDAVVGHVGQGSSNRTFAIVHIYKGLQIFYKQQQSRVEYYIVKVLLWLKAVAALVIGLITGKQQVVKTYLAALKTL
jgi:GT2 family glycosyltransferase